MAAEENRIVIFIRTFQICTGGIERRAPNPKFIVRERATGIAAFEVSDRRQVCIDFNARLGIPRYIGNQCNKWCSILGRAVFLNFIACAENNIYRFVGNREGCGSCDRRIAVNRGIDSYSVTITRGNAGNIRCACHSLAVRYIACLRQVAAAYIRQTEPHRLVFHQITGRVAYNSNDGTLLDC